MKITTLKAILLASLLGLTLGINGCASTPIEETTLEESAPESRSEGKQSDSIEAPEPAHESDDMERLD